jgi:hypothetical protein
METNYILDEIIKKYNIKLEDYDDKDLFVSIMNGKFDKDVDYDDPLILTYIGTYYLYIKQSNSFDYKSMEKYFIKAIDNAKLNDKYNNPTTFAMFYLGNYYNSIKKYDLMEKYYTMYLDNVPNNLHYRTVNYAMIVLGDYYRSIKQPIGSYYDLMKKYYLMTIEYNKDFVSSDYSYRAMYSLADYYAKTERKYDLMKKYMETIIDNASHDSKDIKIKSSNNNIINIPIYAMKYLGNYYKKIEKDNILAQKYLLMAIEKSTEIPFKSDITNSSITDECLPLSMHNL